MAITAEAIRRAHQRYLEYLPVTPTQFSPGLSRRHGAAVHLKCEIFQPIRTFKVRGALVKCAALREAGVRGEVVAASAGNHGLGVAYAAKLLGLTATVFVPWAASAPKVEGMRDLGARVVRTGKGYQDAFEAAWATAREGSLPFVHAFDDPLVASGQGTIGLELPLAELDEVLVPMGGGGLIAGIGTAVKAASPRVKITGVAARNAPAMARALKAGRPVRIPPPVTVADGLTPREVSPLTLEAAMRVVDEVVEVSEEALVRAMAELLEVERILVEPSGAAALAVLGERPREGRVALILTGANIPFRRAVELIDALA